MNAVEIKEFAKDWYTLTRSILPEFGTDRFADFAGQSNSFSYQINPEETGISIHLSKTTQTAYVDLEKKEIHISANYFNPELYAKRFGDEGETQLAELAIALVNGSVVHEALHIRHTDVVGDLVTALETSRYWPTMKAKWGKQICAYAFNIVEDIYIEARTPERLAKWIQATSDILFSADDLHGCELDFSDPTNIINFIVMFKNPTLRDDKMWKLLPSGAREILDELANSESYLPSVRSRVARAFDLLNCFEAPAKKDEEENEDGEGESGDGEGGDSARGDMISSSEMDEILESLDAMSDEEFDELASSVSEASDEVSEEMDYHKEFTSGFSTVSWKPLVERDVTDFRFGDDYHRVSPTNGTDFGFLKELVAIRTLNRTPGAARKTGSVMVKSRLTRIATDGKIFAKRDAQRHTMKRMEIIINVDLSASAYGDVVNNEVGAAMEISKTLRAAGIPHSVYGHTSERSKTPLLVHVFSYEMEKTDTDWDGRFDKMTKIRLEENFDGVIIEGLQEKFTGRQAEKYIINLSDGSPCAPDYRSSAAVAHTKDEIKKARAKGIKVFAISVVSSVVYSNDEIYGKDFNIDASANVAAQFRTLIRRLVGA